MSEEKGWERVNQIADHIVKWQAYEDQAPITMSKQEVKRQARSATNAAKIAEKILTANRKAMRKRPGHIGQLITKGETLAQSGWLALKEQQRTFLKAFAIYGDREDGADFAGISKHMITDWKTGKLFRAWYDKARADPVQFAKDIHIAHAPKGALRIVELQDSPLDSVALSAARLNQEIAGVSQPDKQVEVRIKMFDISAKKPEIIEGEYAEIK